MFIVLKLGRTGSSMLSSILNSHPEIKCKNELLNPVIDKTLKDKQDYFLKYFNQPDGGIELGATLNPLKYDLGEQDLKSMIDSNFKIVVLLRKDNLRQAISSCIAEYNAEKKIDNPWDQPDNYINSAQINLDKLKIRIKQFHKQSNKVLKIAESLCDRFLLVYYEEHIQDFKTSFDRIFEYLEVSIPEKFDYTQNFRKLVDADLRKSVINYDEIASDNELKSYF